MSNILNVNKETSTEIIFNIKNGELVSSRSVFGDESPILLETLFNEIKLTENLIPKKHLVGEVEMTLTDNGSENDVPTFDIFFYRDGELDEDDTPILWLTEKLIYNLTKNLK